MILHFKVDSLFLVIFYQKATDLVAYFYFLPCYSVAINYLLMYDSSTHHSARISENHSNSLDLQYEICSQYMKIASEKLLHQQLDLIQQTSKFIEKITENLNLKDVSTTQESLTLDSAGDQEDPFTQLTKSRLLLRKSRSNGTLRRSQTGLTEAIQEVQRKCSEKTAILLTGIVGEAKRNRQKILSYDRLEKELKKVQTKCQATQAQLLLARKKYVDLQEAKRAIEGELNQIKLKLKESKQQLSCDSLKNSRLSDYPLKHQMLLSQSQKMQKYLEDKELQITRKEKELKFIHNKIESTMQAPIENGCDKCCQMMRKIKDSLVKYRKFLQEEAGLSQALYQNFKSLFL